jgi:hypothetical protein
MLFFGVTSKMKGLNPRRLRLISRASRFLKKANLVVGREAVTIAGRARPKYSARANSQLFTSFHACLTPTLFRRTMFMPG